MAHRGRHHRGGYRTRKNKSSSANTESAPEFRRPTSRSNDINKYLNDASSYDGLAPLVIPKASVDLLNLLVTPLDDSSVAKIDSTLSELDTDSGRLLSNPQTLTTRLENAMNGYRISTFTRFAACTIRVMELCYVYPDVKVPGRGWQVFFFQSGFAGKKYPIPVGLVEHDGVSSLVARCGTKDMPIPHFLDLFMKPEERAESPNLLWRWWNANRKKGFQFNMLPYELRSMIFECCLEHDRVIRVDPFGPGPYNRQSHFLHLPFGYGYRGLLYLSRNLRKQALEVVLKGSVWNVMEPYGLHTLLSNFEGIQGSRLTTIELSVFAFSRLFNIPDGDDAVTLAAFRALPVKRLVVEFPMPQNVEMVTGTGSCKRVFTKWILARLLPWTVSTPEVKLTGYVPSTLKRAFLRRCAEERRVLADQNTEARWLAQYGLPDHKDGSVSDDEEDELGGGVSLGRYASSRGWAGVRPGLVPIDMNIDWLEGHNEDTDGILAAVNNDGEVQSARDDVDPDIWECTCVIPCVVQGMWSQM